MFDLVIYADSEALFVCTRRPLTQNMLCLEIVKCHKRKILQTLPGFVMKYRTNALICLYVNSTYSNYATPQWEILLQSLVFHAHVCYIYMLASLVCTLYVCMCVTCACALRERTRLHSGMWGLTKRYMC